MENEKNESLKKNLDELMRLFKKMKDKSIFDNISGVDPKFFKNFELFVNNYDMIKNNLSEELLSQFGDTIHQMIADTVKKLKEQLNEEYFLDDDINENEKSKDLSTPPELKNWEEEINYIDNMLKRSNLIPAEVDRLLDRRNELIKKHK